MILAGAGVFPILAGAGVFPILAGVGVFPIRGVASPKKLGWKKEGRQIFRDHALQTLGKRGKRPLKHF